MAISPQSERGLGLSNPPANLLRFDYWQLTPLNLFAVAAQSFKPNKLAITTKRAPTAIFATVAAATERSSPRPPSFKCKRNRVQPMIKMQIGLCELNKRVITARKRGKQKQTRCRMPPLLQMKFIS
jgi:hypothetical protein